MHTATRRILTASFAALLSWGFLGGVPDADAADILRKTPGSWFYGPETLYTSSTNATTLFFPLSQPISTAGMLDARFSYQMSQDSGDCKLRAAVRYSNDGVTWDEHKEVNSEYADATDEIIWGTTYVNLMTLAGPTVPRAWIQFGLETKARSNSAVAGCRGALRVELKDK